MRPSLRSWLWRVPLDQEVDEEVTFHIEMRTRELIREGMDPADARDAATRRLGDLAALKRTCVDLGRKRDREMRLTQWIEELRDDVRFALRQLWRAPGFAIVAIATLALGIGANSAIFALVDATLLRPLPFPEPDRLVMVWERSERTARDHVSPPALLDWNERNRTFDLLAGFRPTVGGMVMAGADGTAETVSRQWVTAGFFDVLGIKPIAGRTFRQADDQQRAHVVVMSEGFWRTRFGGDPGIVGRDLRLDGAAYTVVGIVPNDFQMRGRSSIWALVPLSRRPELRNVHALQVIGRMKQGVSLDTASADMTTVADGMAREFPLTNKGRGVRIDPLHDALIGSELRVTSMLFLGVVGIVLLICCANVTNLLLARATVRTRELAIRSALGAGRRRVVRQLLTESLTLSALGGLLGMGLGAAILDLAPAIIPQGLLPAAVNLTFDLRIVAFCAVAALLVGLLFGLAPAWQATERSFVQVIASDSRTSTGRSGRLRGALVIAEVATAVLLLVGAGLLLRTLLAVETFDRGYRAGSVLTMLVDPLGSRYPTRASLLQFFNDVEREVSAVPGVRSLGWTSSRPLNAFDDERVSFEIVGDPPVSERERPTTVSQIASDGYFRTIDLPIVTGRGFSERDTQDSIPVCLVNEAFVRDHLRGRSPVGLQLALRPTDNPQAKPAVREIVGVARQVKGRPDEREDFVQIYVPMAQDAVDDIYLTVAPSAGSADQLTSGVRAAIGRVDKEKLVGVREIMTLDDVMRDATGRHRFRAVLVITFAGLALMLAMVGVFGILAYTVQQRLREFAVRRALGATARDVTHLVVEHAVRVVVPGVLIGLLLAGALGRLLTTILFGVQPLDPLTFVGVALMIPLTALLSIAGPAWRAARVDPAAALRGD